jgi:hypothetical protein
MRSLSPFPFHSCLVTNPPTPSPPLPQQPDQITSYHQVLPKSLHATTSRYQMAISLPSWPFWLLFLHTFSKCGIISASGPHLLFCHSKTLCPCPFQTQYSPISLPLKPHQHTFLAKLHITLQPYHFPPQQLSLSL